MFFLGGVFDVMHQWRYFHHLDVLQLGIEILNFLARVVDFVPLEFGRLQGLTGGHRFVQIRAGGIDFFGEFERGVNTSPGQFAGVVVGRNVQVVLLRHHFDATFTILHVHRPLDVRTTVVFEPQINRYCHVTSPFHLLTHHHPAMAQRGRLAYDRHWPAVPD
ncbi:hypothetical protein D3C85_1497720 [compost metagenome]